MVTLEANPVKVVAQTVVSVGAYTVSQLPVPVTMAEWFALTLRYGAPDMGTYCTGGAIHQVISGTYEVTTWL
jgi:hypothetical protein